MWQFYIEKQQFWNQDIYARNSHSKSDMNQIRNVARNTKPQHEPTYEWTDKLPHPHHNRDNDTF